MRRDNPNITYILTCPKFNEMRLFVMDTVRKSSLDIHDIP